MNTAIRTTLQTGVLYSKTWPVQLELGAVFPENRMIRLTLLLKQWMPPLAVLSVTVQLQYFGWQYLWTALACGLFLLALPLQCYYWLGLRAQSALPPSLHRWYQEVRQQMQQAGVQTPKAGAGKPRYLDLADTLQAAFRQLDKTFFRQWF